MKAAHKVLIIDDEVSVARFVRLSLEANGFVVREAATGQEGLSQIVAEKPDVILLDFGLPDMEGTELLRNLRAWSKTPVIFLTVRDAEADKVAALDAGADDYLTKPFGMPELLARIRVALRHVHSTSGDPVFTAGAFAMDRSGHEVRLAGQKVKLTATEYALLGVLVAHAGKVVPHRKVLFEVWGPNSVEHHHYLRVYFGQIRKKMEAVLPGSSAMIETESGIGYRLKTPP